MMTTANQVALVTGAAKRIGREIALALAKAGWDIAIHYGRSEDEALQLASAIKTLGRHARAYPCDLANESDVKTLFPRVIAEFGAVSCLVNNASIFEFDEANSLSHANLDRHMHINLAAPIFLTHALYEATPSDQCTVTINILDQKLFNMNPDFMSYTLSKSALHTATTMLAQKLAPRVRVVGVAPGLTLVSHPQTHEDFISAHRFSPLGESSRADEVAHAVVFAASNRALTGTTLLVDGGQHLLPLDRDLGFINRRT